MPLDESILASVANANFKSMAEFSVQNLLSHQQRLQILAEKALSKSLEAMDTTSVPEGLGVAAAQRGDLGKVMSELGNVVSSLQQSVKAAQTTPPVTA